MMLESALMRFASAKRRGAGHRVLERADALELGGRDVGQRDRRVGGEGGGFHQATRSAAAGRGSSAASAAGGLELVGIVDREPFEALGQERDDGRAGDLAVGDDPRPGDLQRGVLHVDLGQRRGLARVGRHLAGRLGHERHHHVALDPPHLPGVLAHLAHRADRVGALHGEQLVPGAPDRRRGAERAGRAQDREQRLVAALERVLDPQDVRRRRARDLRRAQARDGRAVALGDLRRSRRCRSRRSRRVNRPLCRAAAIE